MELQSWVESGLAIQSRWMPLRETASWLIKSSADPETAARYLSLFEAQHPVEAARLFGLPTGLPAAVAVFSHSAFLSEEVLRHPSWLREAISSPDLYRVLPSREMASRLCAELPEGTDVPPAQLFALFRRRQLLRILLRDVLGHGTLSEITEEISNVADAILDVALRRIRQKLSARFGVNGQEGGFSVIALGKLGGGELNYSSDIDLMFVYSGQGQAEYFRKVAVALTDHLSTYTNEGLCYRVDLRLRPDGRLGEVCISTEGAQAYYQTRARDWELQMLIKARLAAGDSEPARQLLDSVESRIYSTTLDFSAVEAVSATRERIHEKLASTRRAADNGVDIKLARGGIRDIEFLVQCLQRLHGGREPWVRHAGTLLALQRLNDKDLISDSEYSRLACAYHFLRHLEHRLQLQDDRQTHLLPAAAAQREILARRMPAAELGRAPSADKLMYQLNLHLEEVQSLYDRVIHSQQPLYYFSPAPPRAEEPDDPPAFEHQTSNLIRFLDQRAPGIASVLTRSPLRNAVRPFEAFLEQVLERPQLLAVLDGNSAVTTDVVDIFENSPYYAEELIRRPGLLLEVARARAGDTPDYTEQLKGVQSAAELRRIFRSEMLCIQAQSICGGREIFETLGQTSDLADAVICAAYAMARDEVRGVHPPDGYEPCDQMMVIAVGRLGMREFDLGSDADLNFVLPDEDGHQLRFWTRVAERMVDLIGSYTGEGVMFAVDTRLRPNGREGTLVQTVSSYKDYLARKAEAWEGITYMKSRSVAGNAERSTRFLHELQDVDWRRYGQSGRSRTDLRDMRERLEREQGDNNPLKAGSGGYYDIDFALMYLRLRTAGVFFKVLNTPERIEIIENMGHLDRTDARSLGDAATLYRAIDHGLRVYSGHAEGRLPQSPAHLQALTNLVKRWTPEHLHDQPLADELAQIRSATREYFRRLFG